MAHTQKIIAPMPWPWEGVLCGMRNAEFRKSVFCGIFVAEFFWRNKVYFCKIKIAENALVVALCPSPSRATAGRGEHSVGAPNIFTGPIWEDNFRFFFQNGTFWRTLYFWPTAGPPYPTFSTGLVVTWISVQSYRALDHHAQKPRCALQK